MGALVQLAAPLTVLVVATSFAAALVKGAIGLGFALVLVPALQIAEPEYVPAVALLLTLPLTVTLALRERRHADLRGASWLLVGRAAGTAPGALLVATLPQRALAVVIGTCLIATGAASCVAAPGRSVGPAGKVVGGLAAGVSGTAAAVGGPFMALAYSGRPGPEVRATLSVVFLFGQVASLGALAIGGQITGEHLRAAALLLLPVALGLFAGGLVARDLDPQRVRVILIGLAIVAGTVVIARALLAG